jgi:hypothetical protein
MREICTSGSVGGEDGNVLAYPAQRSAEVRQILILATRRAHHRAHGGQRGAM